jgi:hypothetical protein
VGELVERPADRVQRELAGPYEQLTGLVAELSRRYASGRGAASDRSRERIAAPPR